MNSRIKSFLMLSLLAIALQAFPKSMRAEGFANPFVESVGQSADAEDESESDCDEENEIYQDLTA